MNRTDWLPFYHLAAWKHKTSGRPLFYVALATAVSGRWETAPILLNALGAAGLFMFVGAFDDYWSERLDGEHNYLGEQVRAGRLRTTHALLLACLPLSLAVPVLIWTPNSDFQAGTVRTLYGLALAGLLAYAAPPLRLKKRAPWGFFVAPILTSIMFVASVSVLRPLDPFLISLTGLLFLFQCYAEAIHVVDNMAAGRQVRTLKPQAGIRLMRWLPLASLGSALGLAVLHPVYLLSAAASFMRWQTVRRLEPKDLCRARRSFWSPLWSLYEFVGYAATGIGNLLRT